MSKKRSNEERANTASAGSGAATTGVGGVTPGSLAALVGLGALSALWALFLWAELLLMRAGGSPFCALSEQVDCAAVWDSAFASAVHGSTGLPIAGWGLVWGLTALLFPLLALLRRAEGRSQPELYSAIRLTAGAGAVTVLVMVAVSLAEGALCLGCFGTYVLVGGYAGVALSAWRNVGLPQPQQGATWALAVTAVAYFVLLYPGTHTPRAGGDEGRAALPTADPARDAKVAEFVATLKPELKQTLSDALEVYRNGHREPLDPPRALLGPADAPVRLTEFTDVLCSHCADLHKTLAAVRKGLPEGSFAIDAKHFPLDGACNPLMRGSKAPVRCLAAQAQICMEGRGEDAFAFSGALFDRQRTLTDDKVYELAAPYMSREELQACVASPETNTKLQADIALARRFEITGTPLVLINGQVARSFPPFLYAIVLAEGDPNHKAFATLPAPDPRAREQHDHAH